MRLGGGETVERIGPYDIVAKIGEGGMATVYRAVDTVLGRDVAIKVPEPPPKMDAGQREDFLARFVAEAQAQAKLNHPDIVHIYGFTDVGDGRSAIVMELVQGETLDTVLARGPMPIETALGIARQIAAALDCAHSHGVIHRDVKPANVFVGDAGHAKLADFGIAKLVSGAERRTQVGTAVGTFGYMAPEQVRSEAITAAADIFALGVVTWEMLAGVHPFVREGESAEAAMVRSATEQIPSLAPYGYGALDDVLRAATAKDPASRPASATALVTLLTHEAGLGGPPPAMPPEGPVGSAGAAAPTVVGQWPVAALPTVSAPPASTGSATGLAPAKLGPLTIAQWGLLSGGGMLVLVVLSPSASPCP